MIALEVSSAAGRDAFGGVPGTIRNLVTALLRLDPDTPYHLCYRWSRWRKGHLFRPGAPNARVGLIQDPFNGLLMRGDRLLHSMAISMPRTPRIPKLITVHDLNAVRNTGWVTAHWHEQRSERIRVAVSRSDHVITPSAFIAREVREEYGLAEDRVHPILHGVDTDAIHPASPAEVQRAREEHGDYALAVGLLTPRKNFPRLIEAVARIPALRLLVVGRRSDGAAEFDEAIERHGMRDRVERLQGVPPGELRALMTGARVFAVPSLYEGFGLTVLEAMACDAPVVCSNAASLPEAAGDAAQLVDAADAEALCEALRRVVEDSDLAGQLRKRGRERARAMTWEASAHEHRALYREVAGV